MESDAEKEVTTATTIHLTSQDLIALGVPPDCESLEIATREWSNGGDVTLENLLRACELDIDIHGFAEKVLTVEGFERYLQAVRPCTRRFARERFVVDGALAEFNGARCAVLVGLFRDYVREIG